MGGIEDGEPPLKRVKVPLEILAKNINGFSRRMGRCASSQGDGEIIGSKGIIKKLEFIKIITSALYSLGYDKTGALLEEESGIQLHSSVVNLFMRQVVDGKWDESIASLHKIAPLDKSILKSAIFIILEQKFFEFLNIGEGGVKDALNTLQYEIVPLCTNMSRVNDLATCMISPTMYEMLGFSIEDTGGAAYRSKTLEKLQKVLPLELMIPEKRLEHLVEQALDVQRVSCTFHNTFNTEFSLYKDHHCERMNHIPSQTSLILEEHSDEVWYLQFSHNGKYMASASKDQSAAIWKVDKDGLVSLKCRLYGHKTPVLTVSWSPDDHQLLTCGLEEVVRRWDVNSGTCLHIYEKVGLGLISCGWSPDSKWVFSGVTDKSICMWDLDGKELECWKGHRTTNMSDMCITNDGKKIISRCRETGISLFDRETNIQTLIEEEDVITSFSLSKDNKFLLVDLANQEIHMWSIKGDLRVVSKFKGHKRDRFIIRSCFGGFEQAFIASGSEDSQVYIWHRTITEPALVLPGHSGAVNCVSWNPTNLQMLASASDDHTIRIWGIDHVQVKHNDCQNNGIVHHSNGKS